MSDLFVPPDLDEANEKFGANCGPMALAALLGMNVCDVMAYFGPKWPGYTSGRIMKQALQNTGRKFRELKDGDNLEHAAVAWVTLEGPWSAPGLPAGARYSHSHWVAKRSRETPGTGMPSSDWRVYDPRDRMWFTEKFWRGVCMESWVDHEPKATGWSTLMEIEVVL